MKQAYQPPHKASQQKSTYIAPQKRVENPLAPENFPVFRNASAIHAPTKLNFKDMMQKAEAARVKALEAENYDPLKIEALLPGQLEKEGWKSLSLVRRRSVIEAINERAIAPVETPAEDDTDYWLVRPGPSTLRPRIISHDPELCSVDEEEASEGEEAVEIQDEL